jgi:dCMP deaminase
MNAIVYRNSADVKKCTMYVGLFPCNECAKIIIQSGIQEVVYVSDKYEQKERTKAAKRMFDAAGIKYR